MDPSRKRVPKRGSERIILHFVRLQVLWRFLFPANPAQAASIIPPFLFQERAWPATNSSLQDYDCFYASVFEQRDPALKGLPVGVKQKNILATCNYVARRYGVNKLMLISEAKKICPDLVIVEGEDLTPFRDMSKVLFNFLRSMSWSNKAERLGFDEVFMGR
jgi:DNA polymerase iota